MTLLVPAHQIEGGSDHFDCIPRHSSPSSKITICIYAKIVLAQLVQGDVRLKGIKRPLFGTQTIIVPSSQISRTFDAILLEAELSEVLFSNKK